MVRVVSQNFSPPRSRHSSGETDRDLAERANAALSVLGRKRLDGTEYESSSDSFWDSELDCDTQMSENGEASNDINGNENPEKSDVQSKRKERRRERNKLSAQAYRQRRRTQNVKEQQTLSELEAENRRLHKLVESLEKKTESAKHMLRGCYLPRSEVLQTIGELDGASAEVPSLTPDPVAARPKVPVVSKLMTTSSSHAPLHLSSHSDHPSPLQPQPKFTQKFVPGPGLKETYQLAHITETAKAPSFSYSATAQPKPAICTVLPPGQIILNTNVLIGASLSPSGATSVTIPAFLTIPVENGNSAYPPSNLNCNPYRTCPSDHGSSDNEIFTTLSSDRDSAPSVCGALWWNNSEMKPTPSGGGSHMRGTLVSLVSMDMCNNDNMNNCNLNFDDDANGNASSCDKNVNVRKHTPTSQPASFNLNLNQASGATEPATLCQDICQGKRPAAPVQYFLTPADHVSVQ